MLKTSLRPSCFFSLPQAVGDVSAQIQRDAQRVSFLKQENTEVATLDPQLAMRVAMQVALCGQTQYYIVQHKYCLLHSPSRSCTMLRLPSGHRSSQQHCSMRTVLLHSTYTAGCG